MRQSAVDQFQELLAPPPLNLDEPDLDIIQSLPPNVDYEHLCVAPEAEEIRRAVFSISGDSTPGPDGFTAVFFQKCWKIMERDMTDAVAKFFGGAYLPRSVTSTSIVLITKKVTPVAWADYRPISLCNVTNKIITKILMARLAPLLSLVISPNQSGFVKGRLLNDNVLLGPWRKFSERVQRIRAPKLLIQRRSKTMGHVGLSNGKPSIFFSCEENKKLADNMGYAIIGKFSNSFPTAQQIQKALNNIKFIRSFSWKYINARHILIQFDDLCGLCPSS